MVALEPSHANKTKSSPWCCLLQLAKVLLGLPQLVLNRTLLRPPLLAGQAAILSTARQITFAVRWHLHTWCQMPVYKRARVPCEIRAVEATATIKLKLQTTKAKLLM